MKSLNPPVWTVLEILTWNLTLKPNSRFPNKVFNLKRFTQLLKDTVTYCILYSYKNLNVRCNSDYSEKEIDGCKLTEFINHTEGLQL